VQLLAAGARADANRAVEGGGAVAENERRVAERLDNPTLLATSEPDFGLVALVPGAIRRMPPACADEPGLL
jgi:hypothetical protein